MVDFPYIPKPYLRNKLFEIRFYAPTHLHLAEEEKRDPPPYIRKSVPSRVSGKGTKRDEEFEAERQWLLQQQDAHILTHGARLDAANDDDCDECEDGIECGCCFASYPFVCYFPCVLGKSLTFGLGKDGAVSGCTSILQELHVFLRIQPLGRAQS
jgi:TRIAD3 protein (E3 ubiquitin-protein ligase RNF216)